jgi:type I restriction enzyme S subunit
MVEGQTELPEGWKCVRLGDLVREVNVRQCHLPKSEAEALEVLSLTKNDGLILQSLRFGKRIATDDTSKYKVVREGQIVYNPYVIWEGAVYALRRHPAGLVSPVYPVWETIDPDGGFVDYLLRTPPLIDAYNRVCSGAVNRRRSIREEAFTAIEVTVPPLPEQRAIAEVLRTEQRAKEATEKFIAATRLLKASLMKHLFTYGPVPPGQAEKVALRETAIGPIPGHWSIAKVGAYATAAQYGLSVRGSSKGQYPMLRMNNLQDGKIVAHELQYVDLHPQEFAKFRLRPGDLLFNRTNSFELVGKTSCFNLAGDFVFASYLVRIRLAADGLDPGFLNYYLNTEMTQARLKTLASRGVSQSNINATKLKGFDIPVPPISEQRQIARHLDSVDEKISKEERRREALDALFKSLLHHLMTGKVRLPEFVRGKA